MTDDFLTTPELAAWLRREPRTIQDWRVRGVGPPYVRLGGPSNGGGRSTILYRRSTVEKWLALHEATHTAEEAERSRTAHPRPWE